MTSLEAPWVQAQVDMLESKAEAIEQVVDALEKIHPLYEHGERRHEFRSFVDELRIDAHNYREQAKALRRPVAA